MPQPRKSLEQHDLQNTRPQYVELSSDVAASRPKYPRNISGESKAAFKRLVRLLENRRVCTAGDAEILRLYAIAFDRHVRALDHLAAEGEIAPYTRLDSNGTAHTFYKTNEWLKVATDCEKFMRSCLSDLGLNPLNRAKVAKVKEDAPKTEEEIPTRESTTLPEDFIDITDIDTTVN